MITDTTLHDIRRRWSHNATYPPTNPTAHDFSIAQEDILNLLDEIDTFRLGTNRINRIMEIADDLPAGDIAEIILYADYLRTKRAGLIDP